jgi:High potential iron-sulfur protein
MRPKSRDFSDSSPEGIGKTSGPSRRKLLLSFLWGAALANGVLTLGKSARAQQKVSKELAKYQDSPKDGQKCADCTFFVKPNSCKAVEGDISADGWCQLFTKAAS